MPDKRDDYMAIGGGENLDYMDLSGMLGKKPGALALPEENLDYMRAVVPQGPLPAGPSSQQLFDDPLEAMLRGSAPQIRGRVEAHMPERGLPTGAPSIPELAMPLAELERMMTASIPPKGYKPRPVVTPDDELDPVADPDVPPSKVWLGRGENVYETDKERTYALAGEKMPAKQALFGTIPLGRYMPSMDPNATGISDEQRERRWMWAALAPEVQAGVGATREATQQRFKVFQAIRQEELLGSNPEARMWDEVAAGEVYKGITTAEAGVVQEGSPKPPAPRIKAGLLHAIVANMAWGLNIDGRSPDRTSRGIRRLTELRINKDAAPGDKALTGFDFDKFRKLTGRETLPPDQSIFLLGLAERARSAERLSVIMEDPEVRRVFLLASPPGFDASTPEAAQANLEIARSRAMAWMSDAVRKSPELGNYLEIERDKDGVIIPASFAEDPEYWRKWAKDANLGEVLIRAEVAASRGDFALAHELASAHSEREHIREASGWQAVKNIPASAGRTAIGIAQFYFSAVSYFANQMKWGLEYAGDRAAGGEGAADTEWSKKQFAAQQGLLDGIQGTADLFANTALGGLKFAGLSTMTDREYARWKLEAEHDPVGTALVIFAMADGVFRVGGAAANLHKVRTDGALAAMMEGAKKGGGAYRKVIRVQNVLRGAGAVADLASRPLRVYRAKKMRVAANEWLTEHQATAPQVKERVAAVNEAIKSLSDAAEDAAIKKVLQQELSDLQNVDMHRAALEASLSQLAATPVFGKWFAKWFKSPSKMQLSKDMQVFMGDVRNRGYRKAMDMDSTFDDAYKALENTGVPEADARIWATSMEQGIGQFAGQAAWDVSRPYGKVAEQAIAGAKEAGGKLKVGKVEYDLTALEATAKQQGIDPAGVVHAILAKEMDAFKPKVVLPPDFDRMVTDIAARHKLTEGQAAYKYLVWEFDRVRNQGRVQAASTPEGFVPGQTIRMPELRIGEGGVRHFEWDGVGYQVKPSVVKGATGFDAKYSVWGPKGELRKTRARKPEKSLRHFLGEQVADTGATRRYYTQALGLPEITGVHPEALQFALVTDWALAKVPGKVAGLEAGNLAAFYNELLKSSPALKNLPGGTWARHSIALEMLRQSHPKMYLDPAIPKDAVVSYVDTAGRSTTKSVGDIFHAMGKRVENRAKYRFEAGLKLADQGLIPIGTLGKMGLQYSPRLVLPEVRRAGDFLGALKRFGAEDPMFTGIPTDVRAAFIAEIEQGAIGRKPLPPIGEPTQGPQTRAALGPLEMDPVLGGVEAHKLPGGEALRKRKYLADTQLPGKTGEELYKRIYETGKGADAASFATTVMSTNLADMVGAMRSQGAYIGTIVGDLVGGKILSAEANAFLSSKIGRIADTVDPAARLSMVLDVMRQADSIILAPELRARLAPFLKQAGFDEPVLKGLDDTARTAWKQGTLVSRETQYVLEHIGGPALTDSNYTRTMADLTSWMKGNQIVYQSGPWVRDMISNWAVLGPINGLMPHSRAWSISMQLAETENAVVGALLAAGQRGGPLSEVALGAAGEAIPRGVSAQASQAWAKFRRDLSGQLSGKSGPAKAVEIGALFVKTAGKLSAIPGRTAPGKLLSHQRGMTDFGARCAMLAQKLTKEAVQTAEFMNHLATTAKRYGVRQAGKNLALPFAAEESALGTIGRIADAAWQQAYREARRTKAKGAATAAANKAMGIAYDEVFQVAWKAIEGERASAIVGETIKAFVDYNDKSKIVDALSKTLFGPIYITWSTQAIPMVANYFVQNPVKAAAWRGLYEVFANLNLGMAQAGMDDDEKQTLRQFEKSTPPWQLALPYSSMEFTGAEGETHEMVGSLDASFLQPFSVNLDMVNPVSAPATSALLEASQFATDEQHTPRAMFPLKDHMSPGGPPLVQPGASVPEKGLQFLASQWAKVEPATSPFAMMRMFAGHTFRGQREGLLETGPLPAGYSTPSTYTPLVEAFEGPRKPEQPVAGPIAGIARMFGMRIVPSGEKAAVYRMVQPEEYSQKQSEKAKARGDKAPAGRSVFGHAIVQMHRPAQQVLNDFSDHLDAREDKAQRKGEGNISMGGENWANVETDRARLGRANALYKRLTERGNAMLRTYQAGALHAFRNTDAGELWYKSEDIEYVSAMAKEDVADRLAEVMRYTLEDKQLPRAAKDSDVKYEVLDKAAVEYVFEPLNKAMNAGFTPDAVRGGRMVTAEQVRQASEAEMDVPFSAYVRRYAAEDRTDHTVQRYMGQAEQLPEAAIRARARKKDESKTKLLMAAEPLKEEME